MNQKHKQIIGFWIFNHYLIKAVKQREEFKIDQDNLINILYILNHEIMINQFILNNYLNELKNKKYYNLLVNQINEIKIINMNKLRQK